MNDTFECELPSFQSAFFNRKYVDVAPLASTNESYELSNLNENFQLGNQPDSNAWVNNEAKTNYGLLHDYSEWIDTSKSIQPSKLLSEPSEVSNRKELSRLAQQTENKVESGENNLTSTPSIIYANPSDENFDHEVPTNSRMNQRFCPECGNEITPSSKLYQRSGVLNESVSPRENIHQSSTKKTTVIPTEDVHDVAESSRPQPFINDNQQESFTKKSDIQRQEFNDEGNAATDNGPEVEIAARTGPPKNRLKRQSIVHSSFSAFRYKNRKYTQKQPEVQVAADSMLKNHICPDCGNKINPNSELNQQYGTSNYCVCQREDINRSCSKKTTLTQTKDILVVDDSSHSQPVICDNQKRFTKKSIIQRQKLNRKRNDGTDNAPEVAITPRTGSPKAHLKRQSVQSGFRKSRNKTGKSTQDELEVQVAPDSMLENHVCPDCGKEITSNSKLNQQSGVLNHCVCQREDINRSSSKKALLTLEEEVIDFDDSSRSQPIIGNNQQKRFTKKRVIQRQKLNRKRNDGTVNAPEVAVEERTSSPKTHLKRQPMVHSGLSTSRNKTGKSIQDEHEVPVPASAVMKKDICPDCGNEITSNSKLNQNSGVLNYCVCQREDINRSSPKKTSLTPAKEVIDVADSSLSQPVICDNHQKSFTQKSDSQRQKLNSEGNDGTDDSPESSTTERPYFLKIELKREPEIHSGISTSRKKSRKSFRDDPDVQVAATSRREKNICPICGKDFMKRSKLMRHSVVHTGEKPYICHICRKGYAQKCYLVRHSVTHNGEKPFKCDLCGKEFSQPGNLKRHYVVHPGKSQFNCDICQRGFAFKGDLSKHILIHQRNTSKTTFEKEINMTCQLEAYPLIFKAINVNGFFL